MEIYTIIIVRDVVARDVIVATGRIEVYAIIVVRVDGVILDGV
ncbi:unnamed protein product, partial [marine sediment metagenome]